MKGENNKSLNCAEFYEELSDLELDKVAGGKGGDSGDTRASASKINKRLMQKNQNN